MGSQRRPSILSFGVTETVLQGLVLLRRLLLAYPEYPGPLLAPSPLTYLPHHLPLSPPSPSVSPCLPQVLFVLMPGKLSGVGF